MNKYVSEEQLDEFKLEVIDKYKDDKSPLMQILQESQKRYGCVPVEVQEVISKELHVSTAKINGVVSFYSMFRLVPSGKHILGVCTGTACYVKGASRLVERVETLLDSKYGSTTEDNCFTLAHTRCVGDCAQAPVVMVNEEFNGKVSSDDIPKIIARHQLTCDNNK
jgi:NADH:ubiquinone oxidoreductase subunit E